MPIAKRTQREIAREYGMSFISVVKMFADHGHSMTETAQIIERDATAFRRLCTRHGWNEWFSTGRDCIAVKTYNESRKGVCTDKLRKICMKMVESNPRYIRIERDGITDTLTGHARRLGISVTTMRSRRAVRPTDYDYILSTMSHRKPPPDSARDVWRRNRIEFGK